MNWNTSEDPRALLRHAAGHLPRVVLCRVLCDVAETALPYCDDGAITAAVWAWDATRRWCRGEAGIEEVEAAAAAAARASWAAAAAAAEAAEAARASWASWAAAAAAARASWAAAAAAEAARASWASWAAAEASWAAAAAAEAAEAAAEAAARERRLHSLAILVRLRLPYDPAEHAYALWRDMPICAAMVREQRLCEAGLVLWDADCEAGVAPAFEEVD